MKRFNFKLVILIIAFGLSVCLLFGAGPKGEEEELTFAFVPKMLDNVVYNASKQGAEDIGNELGFKVIWTAPVQADAVQQANIVEDLVSKQVDAIAISVNEAGTLTPAINAAMEAGIPTITFDSDAVDSKRIAYYGTNNYQGGVEMAKLIIEVLGGKGKVALLTGVPGAPNLEERIVGVKDAFKKDAPGMEIISIQACYDDAAKAIEILESFTDAHPELDGWIGIGGWPFFSPLGTMPILEQRAREQGLVVVSFDTLKEELAYIEAGVIYGLVGQKYYGWGYESGKIMWDIAVEGKKYADPIVDSGLDVVTMDGGPGRISVKEMYEKWETGKF